MSAYHQSRQRRHARRKYTEGDIRRMEYLRNVKRMTYEAIGREFGVTSKAVYKQLEEHGYSDCDELITGGDKPLRVPDFSGWDFSRENIA